MLALKRIFLRIRSFMARCLLLLFTRWWSWLTTRAGAVFPGLLSLSCLLWVMMDDLGGTGGKESITAWNHYSQWEKLSIFHVWTTMRPNWVFQDIEYSLIHYWFSPLINRHDVSQPGVQRPRRLTQRWTERRHYRKATVNHQYLGKHGRYHQNTIKIAGIVSMISGNY